MHRTRLVTALILALGLCASSQGSRAAEANEDTAFQKRIFGRVMAGKKIHACYKRVYDPAHLAAHPQQNVRTMLLLVTGDPNDGTSPSYGLGIGVTFRQSGLHFESAGSCGAIHDLAGSALGSAHCSVDCDGGGIDVAIKDATAVLVSIPEGARIWKSGDTSDQPTNERRRFGADDKVFRLDKTALTDCLQLAAEDEKSAMRRGQ